MQALSPTEDSVKQSASTMLTWKEPVVVETQSPTSALRSSKSKSYGASGSPAPGPGGDLLGVNAVNGQSFKPQKQQNGPMNILHNCMPQNGHQEFGSPFMENSRQNGIPESVMVMPMIDFKLPSASTRSNSSSPPSSRKAVRSRARPRKPEEPVPFLSVDTLPADKAVMEGKSYSSKQLSKKQGRSVPKRISPEFIHPTAGRRSQTPNHPPFSPYGGGKSTPRVPSRAGSSLHNYNSFFTHKNSAFLAGPPSLWSLGNRFWPHQATPNEGRRRLAPIQAPMVLEASTLKANYQLSQPFKHNVENSTPIERPVSPGQELKESTMLALHEVTQALARQQDPPPSRKGGRLLKGKLKPLHTFKMDGPGMDECQGILTEDNRGQTADKALLLQRKKELLSMLPPDVFQRSTTGSSLHTRPETQGSVHRNSIVSALSLDRDNPANHPSIQPGQLRSQSMVEEAGPVGPFNSMVMMIDDRIFNQVDIPAVEVQQEGGDPEAKGPETSAKEEGTAVQDPERLMAGGDADKLSDDVSESNMSDYLSELEGGRAEILCNMVKKNSQARNDLTQFDNEPSDATELENGYDDEYPLDSVQQKYPALDSAAMSDDRVGNRKVTTAMKSESQPNLDDNDSINSKNVVPDTVTVDRNESKSDHPEQSYSPSILKDSITQSYVVAETDEQSEGSMQSENKLETIPTEEHLEQPVVSKIETKVPEKAITDKETKINVYGSATLHEQKKMIMQNASEDVSNGTKLEDNRRESNNDSNTNTVPVNDSLRNESQNLNNIPSISLVDGSVKAAVENDIVSNNVEGTPLREGSAEGASSPADDAVSGTPNSDPVLRTGIDALAITLVNEKDVSIVSSKIEQNSPAGDQQQIETAVPKEILSNTADHQSVSVNANISESVVTQNCENDVVKQNNEELLSSAMKEDSDKEVEKKEEEEVDDDAKDTKEKDNGNDGDREKDGGNGNNGDRGTGGGNGNNGDSGTGGGNGNDGDSGTGGGNENNGDSGKGGGNGNDGDGGTGGGNGNDGDSGTGGGNENDGDGGTGGGNGNDGDSGTGGGNGNDGDSGTGGDSGSGTGQGSNSHNDNGGGALGGGGGGGGDGDRNNKDENPGDNENGNSNNHTEDKEVESEEENQVICFKSLEQLLQEIQAQSLCRKEELLSYNDIPEVDDPVLYCDSCGLDEDTCVCPNSSLHRFLGQDEFQNRSELEDEELFDESSQQQNIVLEYKMLLGEPHPGIGCYSNDLLSSREAWNEDGQHASRLSRAKQNSGVPNDIMLTTGVAMTQVQRPISAKVRPGSSKPSRPSSHRGPNGGRGGAKVSLEDADMSDSGCGSEMSEALTQPSQLLTDEMEKNYNLDDDLDLKAQHQEHFGTETSENVSKSANLEIVASTKPRHAKNKTDDTPLLAPFPPLCFKINARPPPGKLYYFSYGATMNPTRLSTYIGSKVEQRLWGILFGFALQFNKKGQDIEAGGFANIEFSPDSSVEGCVYCLNPSQLNSLDKFMGCPE
ncbi:uncharacterized protein LOC586284, partial [Strongylocentrotus purpuratus]|uniref:Uncharacterized protein n=1 Tax=Strongylocentrotus purpuratus TaxID=7668 RepID=A0A7M7SV37_STRPU